MNDTANTPEAHDARRSSRLTAILGVTSGAAVAAGVGTGSVLGPALAVVMTLSAVALVAGRGGEPIPTGMMRLLIPGTVLIAAGSPYLRGTDYWTAAVGLSLIGASVAAFTRNPRIGRIALVLFALVASVALVVLLPEGRLDVWFLHDEAGRVVLGGGSPWADLRVPNGAETATKPFITGYPYPPLILGTYGVVGHILGEPGLLTAAAWFGVAVAFAVRSLKEPGVLPVGWLMVVQPAWGLALWAAWTEPLSIALAVATWLAWRSSKRWRPAALGALLASKQYLIVVTPQVLFGKSMTQAEKAVAFGLAAAVTTAAALWGPRDAFDALLAFHARQPPRPDGLTLFGLTSSLGTGIEVPTVISILAAFAISVIAGRRVGHSEPWGGFCITLSVLFLLGSQAFANYWFLAFALLIIGFIDAGHTDAQGPDRALEQGAP